MGSRNDERMAPWLLKLSMKVADRILYHVTSNLEKDDNCAICLEKLNGNVSILLCEHSFCKGCIDGWIKNGRNRTCPICRYKINHRLCLWTLDDLFEYNERKCNKCNEDLSGGCQFSVDKDTRSDKGTRSIFCNVCVFNEKMYIASLKALEST